MAGIAAKLLDKEESKDFAALLGETLSENETFIGSVVTGTIVGFTPDSVIVDVGLKSEDVSHLKNLALREASLI
jgi:ribosomal protein S1